MNSWVKSIINPATNQIALELNNTLKSKKVTVRCLMINCRVNKLKVTSKYCAFVDA